MSKKVVVSNTHLGTKTLLISLAISQWSGRKFDQNANETVKKAHKTKGEAGNFSKRLLPGAEELAEVHRQATQIRKFFYEQTLPWFNDGVRIMKSENYLPFLKKFNKMQNQYEKACIQFIRVYPKLQKLAKSSLGTLYLKDEYPDIDELKKKFNCETKIQPLATEKDFRVDISESEKKKYVRNVKSAERIAMQDCWKRTYEVVNNAATKLASKDKIFRDSLIDNIKEMCDLLPSLNITDDPKLESKRLQVKKLVESLKPDDLRENKKDRKDAAAKLKEISKSMGAFMGDA